MLVAVATAALALSLKGAAAAASSPSVSFLHRSNRSAGSPAFAAQPGQSVNLKGFCKEPGCNNETDCTPVCTEQPCCCWSTFAADEHPMYPSPEETANKQLCLYPPEGFEYAPDPGLTYDDGMMDALRASSEEIYNNRRLCCLRRKTGVQDESQEDMRYAVPTTTTTTTTTTTEEVPAMFAVDVTPPPPDLKYGDEFENAQMEEAARRHLETAQMLSSAASALNSSTQSIAEVDAKLQTDPDLIRSQKNVARMKKAVLGWAERRWANLGRLEAGDVAAFDNAPTLPPGVKLD